MMALPVGCFPGGASQVTTPDAVQVQRGASHLRAKRLDPLRPFNRTEEQRI